MVLRPALWASPENLLERQILGPIPDLLSPTLWNGAWQPVQQALQVILMCCWNLRTTDLKEQHKLWPPVLPSLLFPKPISGLLFLIQKGGRDRFKVREKWVRESKRKDFLPAPGGLLVWTACGKDQESFPKQSDSFWINKESAWMETDTSLKARLTIVLGSTAFLKNFADPLYIANVFIYNDT